MTKKLPKLRNLLICDDIRQEKGNKISLNGIYTNGVFFTKDSGTRTMPQICIFAQFDDVEGFEEFTFNVLSPSGEGMVDLDPRTLEPGAGSMLFSTRIVTPTFDEDGDYVLEFKFDKKSVKHTLRVGSA